ncbi:nucleotidyl transferase AbiEii/AbiGii toxin family protein [Nonomuraea sp. NN258]|uniref:nucleotidyl transferase AbiEii/AbiGii toxin family protein n=1 Tax=Nonomuraea antri TaxID=2730852 RepID=UPI0015699570|nr:nucleotidyl transferase AbiEii/AbiGii toxin family protein [Nonomuraea antri]NRQ36249.1 nucleotidyl transferase AbiEii/AbiGii toxin family protein [Nonomuraea antri]
MTSARKRAARRAAAAAAAAGPEPIPEPGGPGLPATYLPLAHGAGARQRPIFDPALKHFPRAFRAGEPAFADEETGRRWRRARRLAIDHLVKVVADSRWQAHLVLRGSLLLEAWVGERAREPGDLDWVVVPHTVESDGRLAGETFRGLMSAAVTTPAESGEVRISAEGIAVDDIWSYERAPGRRIVFTWHADGLPPGTVQLDFVFNEALPVPPEQALIPRAGGAEPTLVQAASPELSLAWKLQWLVGDVHPQGKDLYDAVLLAERVTVPRDLLDRVLEDVLEGWGAEMTFARLLRRTEVDWAEFRAEYPAVRGDARTWMDRLISALGPTLET